MLNQNWGGHWARVWTTLRFVAERKSGLLRRPLSISLGGQDPPGYGPEERTGHGKTGQQFKSGQSRAWTKSRAGHDGYGHCAIRISNCTVQGQNAGQGKNGQIRVSGNFEKQQVRRTIIHGFTIAQSWHQISNISR